MESNSTIQVFLNQFCDFAPEHKLSKRDFYECYRNFCLASGTTPLKINNLCKILKSEFGIEEGRIRDERFWKGLRLRLMDEANAVQPAEAVSQAENPRHLIPRPEEPKTFSDSTLKIESAVNELNLRDLIGAWEIQRF